MRFPVKVSDDDLRIIRQAAEKWVEEIDSNIIPNTPDPEDAASFQAQREEIAAALDRSYTK